ncbi:MMPL family transporter, partial [Teichococcus aerofrigidensis]
WQGLVIPAGVRDPAALRQALTALGEPAILFIDVKAETTGLVLAASREALFWAAAGALGVLALLALGLRGGGPLAALRRGAPILAALLVTLAALALLDQRLTPFHLAALLLSAGVGIDYALFLARPARDPAEARRGLEAVLTCAVTTLLTFGLLALCATPVLRGIGLTVAIGVTAAFLLSLALAPRPAR